MFKTTIQILIGIALAAQLTGCFYHDDNWHHDHDRDFHPEHHEHDSGIDVHVHG